MILRAILAEAEPRLADILEDEAAAIPGERQWSKKQILGHLVDSAANNHVRFIRAQLESHVDLASYRQEEWVRVQAYQDEPWEDLTALWLQYNRHLAHVIEVIPPEAMAHTISLDGRPPVTLSFLIEDYIRHLQHHLSQIL